MLRKLLPAFLLVLLSFVQYFNTLNHEYAWDDPIVIQDNDRVQQGIGGIVELFKNYQSEKLNDQYGYRPVTLTSFALDITLFGKDNPGPSHFINVLIFGLLCAVLYFTLQQVFPTVSPIFCFLVSILFLVHPIHVEVVANIKSRDESLSLLFSLLALYAYLKAFHTKKWSWILPASLCFLLGFLSKESAITFLAVFVFAVLIQPEGNLKSKLVWTLPIPALAILVGIIAWVSQTGLAVSEMAETAGTGVYFEAPIMGNSLLQPRTHVQTAATIPVIMLQYLKNFCFPYPLVYYYGYNQLPLSDWSNWQVYLSLLLHIGLIVLAVISWKKRRSISFAIGFYFITLSPYLHIVRVLSDTMADRFLFMPSVGLCLLVVSLLAWAFKFPLENLPQKTSSKKRKKAPPSAFQQVWKHHKVFLLVFGVLLIMGMARTWSRNPAWKNNTTLTTTDIPHLEECARCHYQYALVLTEQYETVNQLDRSKLEQEITHHLERAIEITPEAYNSFLKLGEAYKVFGNLPMSSATYEKAVKQFPDQARPWYYLGESYWFQERYAQAILPLTKSTEMAPNQQDNWFFLGWSQFHTGNPTAAIETFTTAKNRFPEIFRFYHAISDVYFEINQPEQGFTWLLAGHAVTPNELAAYQMLVYRYQSVGNLEKAAYYEQEGIGKGIFK